MAAGISKVVGPYPGELLHSTLPPVVKLLVALNLCSPLTSCLVGRQLVYSTQKTLTNTGKNSNEWKLVGNNSFSQKTGEDAKPKVAEKMESQRMAEFRKKLRETTPITDLGEQMEAKPKDDPLPAWPDNTNPHTGEVGGPKGPEPTRYGDWERKGRVTDF